MLSVDLILIICLGYVVLLFALAFVVDRRSRRGRLHWLRSPLIYTLSISVYCTSWTFFGAVGSAARNGLEFVTIYLGPTLVFIGWWWLLRKLVRIGRVHRITSIADLISSRYGKSSSLAVLVTVISVMAITPYIALQLQSVTRSYQVVAGGADSTTTAFWIAAGMALFTILFGTRNLDANERHHGVVAAIAVEAVIKLVALIVIGVYAVYGLAGGWREIFANVPDEVIYGQEGVFGSRWIVLTFLSASAIICLPRQFQITVVENVEEKHLATASWLFPLYLFGMSIFIMPIAIAGLKFLPSGSNPDLFVLTLPLQSGRQDLALLAFLGGFSSAASMVIVAAIAVSTMLSNHVVMPIALHFFSAQHQVSGDVRNLLLTTRRISIALVLGLGFLYFQFSGGSDALAAIGLIAFVGVAQFLPSLVGGIFWRGATRMGALVGLGFGFFLWAYTLFLPSFGGDFPQIATMLEVGPWGIDLLRPEALLGLQDVEPLTHALIWSLGTNTLLFLIVSGLSDMRPLERLQGALFVDVFRSASGETPRFVGGKATSEDLFVLAQRILGAEPARALFDEMARSEGTVDGLPSPNDAVITRLERELSGSVGAASAHAMVSRIAGQEMIGITELINIADETQRLIETSRQLSEKSTELERAARQLRDANERLRSLDARKDEFLNQVSHELRTPMTSIRSFSEILLSAEPVDEAERQRFIAIIHEECLRLTRLLDEILDISRLEAGTLDLALSPIDPGNAIDTAIATVSGFARKSGVTVESQPVAEKVRVRANEDRLCQVLINLLTNAVKYNDADNPWIKLKPQVVAGRLNIDVIDNGGGVGRDEAVAMFEKFTRGRRAERDQGAGLGLPISRAIMRTMGGDLTIEFLADDSTFFRVSLALADT
ncbi:sensor histidine kinase [Limibacillus halophilus]|uniref:histidine kinase n=1 Tax=Limibacillus halophilus TaxID=1579333 RepID=A0A839SWV8_9PROT|nr:sensor histidine kinase [Limibacillus halophilus]MBB3066170.1 Na+/proline symporter/signal transduction histidine kinase [Limibacillus halophilus]